MPRVDEIFHVEYGNKLDMNKMTPNPNGVAFVGRKGSDQGVSGWVRRLPHVEPYPAGLLTTALGGSRLLATFVQQNAFYTAQNVAVLHPRDVEMSIQERLFYALAITANRFRYTAFGREANRSFRTIELPEFIPDWVEAVPPPSSKSIDLSGTVPPGRVEARRGDKRLVRLGDIFDARYGHSLELNRLIRAEPPQGVNFVGRSASNNGVTARVEKPVEITPAKSGSLSVALGGSVLSTFVQPEPFLCGRDVMILTPHDSSMSYGERLWWARVIGSNAYRYSYGRQANRTLIDLMLPAEVPPFVGEVICDLQANKLF